MLEYLDRIIPVRRLAAMKGLDGVHSAREFASILNRERDRADRTNQEFSLAVFEVGFENGNSEAARHLVPILAHRIRSTDDIGWLEDGRIGVVLPHTTPDGAWKFVDNVRAACNGTRPVPDCQVFSYPSWWLPGGNGRVSRRPDAGEATISRHDSGESGMRRAAAAVTDRVRPVDDLESQFQCRMPAWKRFIDVVGSVFAMVLLSPLFLIVALLIKAVSPGLLFFRQERVGYMGRTFRIWKFRTMHVNADTTVHRRHLHDLMNNERVMTKLDNEKDGRIIPLGGILRAAGIDELPQLLNVLLGDMSLVGPRPCLPYEAAEFQTWQTRRFDTVPGLTGLWQVSGKNKTTFKEMMRLDIAYARKRAFWLDVRIFLKTIPAVVDQVSDRPAVARAHAKGMSAIARLGSLILAALTLNRLHK